MKFSTSAAAFAAFVPMVYGARSCTDSTTCCSKLAKAKLQGQILDPSTSLYDTLMGTYWSESAAVEPTCIALPASAEDVSTIIKIISDKKCKFGIRGGGHGAFPGSNSLGKGVTIDFSWLNSTSYNEDTGLASVSPGTHWQNVYDTLDPYGVAVAGGRAGTVGTGGFTSGGGNSFHSASHGMSCDTVANWNVVLADGTITNANATYNEDLFTAMKGSSGNLALITSYDMYPIAFDNGDSRIWGGNLFYDLEVGDSVLDELSVFAENQGKDENTTAIVYWAYLPNILGGYILNAALENTRAVVKPAAVEGFYSLDGLTDDTTKVETMSTVTLELGAGQPSGFNNVWLTSSFLNDPAVMKYIRDRYFELDATLTELMPPADSGLNTLCMFQPLTKSMTDKSLANGGNVMGLEHFTEQGAGIMFLLTFAVNGDKADEYEAIARPYLEAFMQDADAFAKKQGVFWEWKYLNYADYTQDPLSTIGDEAIAKLQAASAKYDPNGVFQKLRSSRAHKIPA